MPPRFADLARRAALITVKGNQPGLYAQLAWPRRQVPWMGSPRSAR